MQEHHTAKDLLEAYGAETVAHALAGVMNWQNKMDRMADIMDALGEPAAAIRLSGTLVQLDGVITRGLEREGIDDASNLATPATDKPAQEPSPKVTNLTAIRGGRR